MMRRGDDGEYEMIRVVTSAGTVGLFLSRKGIVRIELPRGRAVLRPATQGNRQSSIGKAAATLVRRYFSGERVTFDVPLDLRHATIFQRAV